MFLIFLSVLSHVYTFNQLIQAHPRDHRLITSASRIEIYWQGQARHDTRRQAITLNLEFLSLQAIHEGDKITVDLFSEAQLNITVIRVFVDVNQTLSILGRVEGFQFGSFLLSSKNGLTFVTIDLPEKQKRYLITYDRPSGTHYLTEIVPQLADQWQCAPPLIPDDFSIINDTVHNSQDSFQNLNDIQNSNFRIEIIATPNYTYGYNILLNGRIFIHQPHIPAISGHKGFAKMQDAQKVAELVIHKLRQNLIPSISLEELDSLGIDHFKQGVDKK